MSVARRVWRLPAASGTMRYMVQGETRNPLSQLRRGILEYCVLAALRGGARYGFELVRALSQTDGLVTSEGTIYPLLTRLRKDGLVNTFWSESDAGPPRRYYELNADGEAALTKFTADWTRFSEAVSRLITEERNGTADK